MGEWLQKIRRRLRIKNPVLRRFVIASVGIMVLAIGIALLVLPGPAVLVIPLGLAILATEFIWARRWLEKMKALLQHAKRPKDLKVKLRALYRALSPK